MFSGRCPRGRCGANRTAIVSLLLRMLPPRMPTPSQVGGEKEAAEPVRHGFRRSASKRRVTSRRQASLSVRAKGRALPGNPPRRSARHSGAGRLSTTRTIGHGQDPPFLRVPRRPPACVGGYAAATRPRDAPPVYPATGFSTSARQLVAGWIRWSRCSGHHWRHHAPASMIAADRPGRRGADSRGKSQAGQRPTRVHVTGRDGFRRR